MVVKLFHHLLLLRCRASKVRMSWLYRKEKLVYFGKYNSMLILAYEKRMKHNAMFDSKKIQRKEKKNV